jgi:glutathione S-transferase
MAELAILGAHRARHNAAIFRIAPTMSDLILHHYKESPYAEKVRTLMGHKGVAWQSVTVPRIAPKPDLTALTGGYRKVPVLQRGADIFCDTRLICAEIERLHPVPSAAATPGHFGAVIEHWVDVHLFAKAVAYTFGRNADHLPDALLADRAALRGAPLEREALKAAVPLAEQELRRHLGWVEAGLQAPSPFVNGKHPGPGDFNLYATVWFAVQGRFDLTPFTALSTWFGRMQGMGHGQRVDSTPEAAMAIAAESRPRPLTYESQLPDASGLELGQMVCVTPELLGHGTSVRGELVGIDGERVSLLVLSERCGALHVHFPRQGYRLLAA